MSGQAAARLHLSGQKHLYPFAVLLRESRQNVAGICSSAPWRRRHRSHAVLSIYAATVMGLDEKRQDYRGIVVTMIHKFRDMPAASLRCQLGNLAKAESYLFARRVRVWDFIVGKLILAAVQPVWANQMEVFCFGSLATCNR
jgi:hypothetical protein